MKNKKLFGIFRIRPKYEKVKEIKEPCYMCDSARVSCDLNEGYDYSAITVGSTYSLCNRIMICSGKNQPVHIEFEELNSVHGLWSVAGKYYPKYCPNCGRELSEYFVEERGTGAYENALVGKFDD